MAHVEASGQLGIAPRTHSMMRLQRKLQQPAQERHQLLLFAGIHAHDTVRIGSRRQLSQFEPLRVGWHYPPARKGIRVHREHCSPPILPYLGKSQGCLKVHCGWQHARASSLTLVLPVTHFALQFIGARCWSRLISPYPYSPDLMWMQLAGQQKQSHVCQRRHAFKKKS